jgi:hypothetical protein
MTTLKVTVTFSYEADPDNYGTQDPIEMAEIDRGNFASDPMHLLGCLEDNYTVTVEASS